MPRANRHHIPGQVWHITHRCHQREFLFKFAKDRKRWLQWLFEAKKQEHGFGTVGRETVKAGGDYLLREPGVAYNSHFGPEKVDLSPENTIFFMINEDKSIC